MFSGIFSISFSPSVVSAQGLNEDPGWTGIVPCGRNKDVQGNEGAVCTLCDLVVGVHRLFSYGLYIILAVALFVFVLAAVMYTVSTGDQGMMDTAKKAMLNSMIGLVIVACSWLLVNATLFAISANPDNLGMQMTNWYSLEINCGMHQDPDGCCLASNGGCSSSKADECIGTFYVGACTENPAAQFCTPDDEIMGCCIITTELDGSERIDESNCKPNSNQMECNSLSGGLGMLWDGFDDCTTIPASDFDTYCKEVRYTCRNDKCVKEEGGPYKTTTDCEEDGCEPKYCCIADTENENEFGPDNCRDDVTQDVCLSLGENPETFDGLCADYSDRERTCVKRRYACVENLCREVNESEYDDRWLFAESNCNDKCTLPAEGTDCAPGAECTRADGFVDMNGARTYDCPEGDEKVTKPDMTCDIPGSPSPLLCCRPTNVDSQTCESSDGLLEGVCLYDETFGNCMNGYSKITSNDCGTDQKCCYPDKVEGADCSIVDYINSSCEFEEPDGEYDEDPLGYNCGSDLTCYYGYVGREDTCSYPGSEKIAKCKEEEGIIFKTCPDDYEGWDGYECEDGWRCCVPEED